MNERTNRNQCPEKPTPANSFVIGADMYNQRLTGKIAMTVSCSATDSHHVPCVVLFRKK